MPHVVNKASLASVCTDYLMQYHFPKIKGTMKGFFLGMKLQSLPATVDNMIAENAEDLISEGIMTASGDIDIDKLYEMANYSLELNGEVDFPKLKYKATKDDIEAIRTIARQYATLI